MGKRIDDKRREQARAIIYLNPDVSEPELARSIGIGKSTAHYLKKDIVDNEIGSDNLETLREQKKAEFIQEAWDTVKKIHLKINDKLDAMSADELKKANIRDLAIALGTIYDKQALASGEPTQITERQEPTPELVKELDQKVKRLKELTGT